MQTGSSRGVFYDHAADQQASTGAKHSCSGTAGEGFCLFFFFFWSSNDLKTNDMTRDLQYYKRVTKHS